MEILIDADQGPDGRLSGTAGLMGSRTILPFSGNLELLARVEELCRKSAETGRPTNPTSPLRKDDRD